MAMGEDASYCVKTPFSKGYASFWSSSDVPAVSDTFDISGAIPHSDVTATAQPSRSFDSSGGEWLGATKMDTRVRATTVWMVSTQFSTYSKPGAELQGIVQGDPLRRQKLRQGKFDSEVLGLYLASRVLDTVEG